MANISQLNQSHFVISKGVLTIKFNQPIVVLFTCGENHIVGPHINNFRQLSGMCNSVAYGIVNLLPQGGYPQIRQSSLQTNTPLQSQITLILYINGAPRSKLVPSAPQQMAMAINTALKQIMQKQNTPKNTPSNMYGGNATAANAHTYYPSELSQQPKLTGLKNIQPNDFSEQELSIPPDAIPYNNPWIADTYE